MNYTAMQVTQHITAPLVEHAIPAARLAPLLHDRQRVCECCMDYGADCPNPATWAAVFSGPCTDGASPSTWLLCEQHKRGFLRDGGAECYGCGAILTVVRIEALR